MHERRRGLIKDAALACAALAPFVFLCVVMLGRVSVAPPADRKLVIPPGRESEVMAFLGQDAREFAGVPVGNVQIERDVIVLQMDGGAGAPGCALPREVHAPGGAIVGPRGSELAGAKSAPSGELVVSWFTCGMPEADARAAGERLAQALAGRSHERIWSWVEGHAKAGLGGILGPFVRRWGSNLAPTRLLAALFAVGAVLAAIAAALSPRDATPIVPLSSAPSSRRRIAAVVAAVIVVAAGAFLRLRAAASLPLDGDEIWALPSVHSIVTDDHDAWVHPPMHRALQQAWVHFVGWQEGGGLGTLRAISSVASIAALALLALRLARGSTATFSVVLAFVAAMPAVVGASVLARPYGLACLAVVIVAASTMPSDERPPSRVGWFVAILGVALAAWTDLIAGLAAGALLGTSIVQSLVRFRLRALAGALTATFAALVLCVSLLPGAIAAIHEQVHPVTAEGSPPGPDLRPSGGIGDGKPTRSVVAWAEFETLGLDPATKHGALTAVGAILALVLVTVAAARAKSVPLGAAPWLLLALCVTAGTSVALRARNVLFLPYVGGLFVAWALGAGGSIAGKSQRARRDSNARPTA